MNATSTVFHLARIAVAVAAGTFAAREGVRWPILPGYPRVSGFLTGMSAAVGVWSVTAPRGRAVLAGARR